VRSPSCRRKRPRILRDENRFQFDSLDSRRRLPDSLRRPDRVVADVYVGMITQERIPPAKRFPILCHHHYIFVTSSPVRSCVTNQAARLRALNVKMEPAISGRKSLKPEPVKYRSILERSNTMKAVIPATPLTDTMKLQDTTAACGESEDGKNCRWLHDASHLAQSNHGIRKEMKRATTEGGVENAVFEWNCLHPCTGEMHIGSAFLCNESCALPKHPHRYVDSEHLLRR